jgi:DNA-binding transcriptional regulator YiaG
LNNNWDGKAIKKLRKRLGISQKEFGKRISEVLGLDKPKFAQQIVRWETEINKPSEIYIKALDIISEQNMNQEKTK